MGIIIGIDEAGRGSIAGPIVGAAILSVGRPKQLAILAQVKDSKLLSPARRAALYDLLVKNFIFGIHAVDNRRIDRYGIQPANLEVFSRALSKLGKIGQSAAVLGDYVGGGRSRLPHINFYKKGESCFAEIAAASIIAKVYRDRLMQLFHDKYREYGFDQHKGYGTSAHYEAIKKYGASPIHRRSFISLST